MPPTARSRSASIDASILVGSVAACPGPPVGSHRSGRPRKPRPATQHYGSSELGSAGTSTACFRSASIGTICSTASLVEASTTGASTPSLGAGNDPDRVHDLETTHRVAEFKLSSWKGQDGMRQRGLFADVVGLALDETARRRQVYVVGDLPVRYLTTSRRNAVKALSKAALRLRTPHGLTDAMTVSEYTKAAQVEVIDLTAMLPRLRRQPLGV
jgi:hypothetical protein